MSGQDNNTPRSMTDKYNDPEWGASHLKSINIFKQFFHDELIELYKQGRIINLKPQSHAVIEGDNTRGLYIVLHGSLSVHKNDLLTGAMHRIAYLDEGSSFGEMSLLDRSPRSATVVAECFCHLFYLDAAAFEKFLEKSGNNLQVRFYKTCAEDLSDRFRIINSDYISSQKLLWKYALRRDDSSNNKLPPKEKPSKIPAEK